MGARYWFFILLGFAPLAHSIECASGEVVGAYRTTSTEMGDAQSCVDGLPSSLEDAVVLSSYASSANSCFAIKASATTYFGPVTVSDLPNAYNLTSQRFRDSNDTPLAFLSGVSSIKVCIPDVPPPSCDPDSGFVMDAVFPDDEYPPVLCQGTCTMNMQQRLSGFGLSLTGAPTGYSVYQYRNNGGICSDEPDIVDLGLASPNQPVAGEHSVMPHPIGSGEPNDSTQCGFVNGEQFCIQRNQPPEGGCITTQSGAAFCGALAQDGPKDAQGNPVPPDVQVEHEQPNGNTNVFNYWTNTTLSDNASQGGSGPDGSPNPDGPGDGSGDGDGGDGSGDGSGDGEGEGDGEPLTGEISEDCETPPDCSEATSIECAIVRQQWSDTCRAYAYIPSGDDPTQFQSDLTGLAISAGFLEVNNAGSVGEEPTVRLSPQEVGALSLIRQDVDLSDWLAQLVPQPNEAQCPAPFSVTVFGEAIPINFEHICLFLGYIGIFVIVGSTLNAFRIAFGF